MSERNRIPSTESDPLRLALADGGPPFLSQEWKLWVLARHQRRRVNESAAAIAHLLVDDPDFRSADGRPFAHPVAVVDRLISDWHRDRAENWASADSVPHLRAFLRASATATATWLADHGVGAAWLWRGEAVCGPRGSKGTYIQIDLPERSFATVFLPYAANMARWRSQQQRQRRSGRLLLFRVPAARIVGTSATGIGAPDAGEVVLTGGPVDAWCWRLTPEVIQRSLSDQLETQLLTDISNQVKGDHPMPGCGLNR